VDGELSGKKRGFGRRIGIWKDMLIEDNVPREINLLAFKIHHFVCLFFHRDNPTKHTEVLEVETYLSLVCLWT